MRKFLFGLAPLMGMMAVFVVSGIAAGSAAAFPPPYCAEATEPATVANWELRNPARLLGGVCEKKVAVGVGKFVEVTEITHFINATEACALAVEPTVVGNYEDSECTKKVAVGKGKYVKVVWEPCTEFVLCSGKNEKLRDNSTTPPTGGEFGTEALAVNTAGSLRLTAKIAGLAAHNENPKGYAFFGIKLGKNPASANCNIAEGSVTFADLQDATTGGAESPVFPNNVVWPIKVRSDKCTTEPGVVTIESVGLFFPNFHELKATGTFTGKWVQPGACPGGSGGIELNVKQTGVALSTGTEPEIDNGTTGKPAFICFVSAENYLYPTTAPTWTPLTGAIWKD
jgi:hypothetical protein